jgi:hypothetical protein
MGKRNKTALDTQDLRSGRASMVSQSEIGDDKRIIRLAPDRSLYVLEAGVGDLCRAVDDLRRRLDLLFKRDA